MMGSRQVEQSALFYDFSLDRHVLKPLGNGLLQQNRHSGRSEGLLSGSD